MLSSVTAALAVVLLSALAAVCFKKGSRTRFVRSLASVLLAGACIQLGNGFSTFDPVRELLWKRLALVGEIAFALALLRWGWRHFGTLPQSRRGIPFDRTLATTAAAILAVSCASNLVLLSAAAEGGEIQIALGPAGHVLYVLLLLALVAGVAQLESALRALQEPERYRLKFVLVGVGALAGYRIYEMSRLLLLPVWQRDFVLVGSVVSIASALLVAEGLRRIGSSDGAVRLMVSPQVLYGSMTFLVIGLYLLGVGLVGQMIRISGWPFGVVVSILLGFAAAVALVLHEGGRL